MKCLCPACGRTTQIEPQLLGFFDRCIRCGVLLRPRVAAEAMDPGGGDAVPPLTAKIVPVGRVRESMANANGRLADLLSRPALAALAVPPRDRILPSPAVAAHDMPRSPRQEPSPRRALLRQHHQTLGIVGICGSALVMILAALALTLKARSLGTPRTSQASVIQLQNRRPARPPHEVATVARGDPAIP